MTGDTRRSAYRRWWYSVKVATAVVAMESVIDSGGVSYHYTNTCGTDGGECSM